MKNSPCLILTLIACLFAIAQVKSRVDSNNAYNEAGVGCAPSPRFSSQVETSATPVAP